MKRLTLVIIGIVLVLGFAIWFSQHRGLSADKTGNMTSAAHPEDATYRINGKDVTLVNGQNETAIEGSASKIITRVWSGEPQFGDLNGDGINDAVIIIIQETSGSGIFFYVAAALKNQTTGGYNGTDAYVLGDRIAPQNFSISKGIIEVNYADREPWQPMTTPPSVGATTYLHVVNGAVVASEQ